jgi:aspartate/methionine/tyrosine aminotransferase
VLLLNSPHNPTGKVFTLAELEGIAAIVREHPQLVVISDEVYKYTIYDAVEPGDGAGSPVGHYHFARLPGMWDRTVTISSAGKTFSVTGWQVGWLVGPERYVGPVQVMLPSVQFCTATPMQEALCSALQEADAPYLGHSRYATPAWFLYRTFTPKIIQSLV